MRRISLVLTILIFCYSCSVEFNITSFNLVAPPYTAHQEDFNALADSGVQSIVLNPYCFNDGSSSNLIYDLDWQWWGETTSGTRECIRMAKVANLEVGIIPHLWINQGDFSGTFSWKNERQFLDLYGKYISILAKIAEEEGADFFVIGKEMGGILSRNPNTVRLIVENIKTLYSGPISYAANWDEIDKFKQWNLFDAIAVNAYFPMHTKEAIKQAKQTLIQTAEKENLSIWITEWGFRKDENCLEKPYSYEKCEYSSTCQKQGIQTFAKEILSLPQITKHFYWKKFLKPEYNHEGDCGYSLD